MKHKKVIIQSYKDTAWINHKLEYFNYTLFNYFKQDVEYEYKQVFFSQVNRMTHNLFYESYAKGIKIFVEK